MNDSSSGRCCTRRVRARGLTIAEAAPVADGPGWWLTFREVTSRDAAEALRDIYLEIDTPDEPPRGGSLAVARARGPRRPRRATGEELGTIVEIYRAGGAEVFVVRGPRGELDIPGVRGIVLDLAPERGEMIVDLEALALDARPVEDDDYVRPRDRRPQKAARSRRGAAAAGTAERPAARAGRRPR